MRRTSRNAPSAMARIAAANKGIVTRADLLAAGASGSAIDRRIRNGLLIPEYRGVYRVGHAAPSADATYMAAVKACGAGSGLSGIAAAWLLHLVNGDAPPPEVSTPRDRRIPGLKTRRRLLHPSELTEHRGTPVTSVPLTLLDLASSLPQFELGKACHEAGFHHDTTPAMVKAVLARRPNVKGAAKLRAILHGDPIALSRLEERFLALLRANALPLPITNKPAGGRRVDARWPDHRLTVELDSYTFHNSRHAWEAEGASARPTPAATSSAATPGAT